MVPFTQNNQVRNASVMRSNHQDKTPIVFDRQEVHGRRDKSMSTISCLRTKLPELRN